MLTTLDLYANIHADPCKRASIARAESSAAFLSNRLNPALHRRIVTNKPRHNPILFRSMSDRISEIFGYIVIAAAIVLSVWEYRNFSSRDDDDAWLYTDRRFRRRILVSVILAAIGVLIALEAHGTINLHQLVALSFYLFTLTGLAVLLLLLAALDLADTAKAANRRTMQEFEAAVEAEKRRLAMESAKASEA